MARDRGGMEMEYVYVIGGIFLVSLFVFFRYLMLHCSQTHHPAVHIMRHGDLNPGLQVVPRSSFPYTISGAIPAYSHVTPVRLAASVNTHYAPLYTLPASTALPSDIITPLGGSRWHGRHRRMRIAPWTTWTPHGPPDYDTVMAAGHVNTTFVLEEEPLPCHTPPPSYESVVATIGTPPMPRS